MLRHNRIGPEELKADVIFLLVGAAVSFLALLIFDLHWNLYSWPAGPLKLIFQTPTPYLIGVPVGAIILFILIKLMALGFYDEELALKKARKRR